MKPLIYDELKKKFWEGETSQEEELFLKENWEDNAFEISEKEYLRFIATEPIVPENLEAEIWNTIQNQKPRFKIGIRHWVAAASFALICTMGGYFYHQHQLNEMEKQFAMLENTLQYISDQVAPEPEPNILYEDDMIVIVANN